MLHLSLHYIYTWHLAYFSTVHQVLDLQLDLQAVLQLDLHLDLHADLQVILQDTAALILQSIYRTGTEVQGQLI